MQITVQPNTAALDFPVVTRRDMLLTGMAWQLKRCANDDLLACQSVVLNNDEILNQIYRMEDGQNGCGHSFVSFEQIVDVLSDGIFRGVASFSQRPSGIAHAARSATLRHLREYGQPWGGVLVVVAGNGSSFTNHISQAALHTVSALVEPGTTSICGSYVAPKLQDEVLVTVISACWFKPQEKYSEFASSHINF